MQVGRLWCALADFYIRQGMFERARDVYQEGVEAVITVRDFSLVFEALTKFEQALVEAQIEEAGDAEEMELDDGPDGANFLLVDDGVDIELRLERLEWLLARRPLLLSSVMLRQNPHAVQVWQPPDTTRSMGCSAMQASRDRANGNTTRSAGVAQAGQAL